MQHLETCLLIAETDGVLCINVVKLLTVFFLLDAQNEIQMLARFLSYSWPVCLLVFLVEKFAACQSHRKSDFGWHRFVFHLA